MVKNLRVKIDDIAFKGVGVRHKYVRHSSLGIVLWPESDMVWHMSVGKLLDYHIGPDIVSAGFVSFDAQGRPTCHGQSDSLGLKARPEDTSILRAQMGMKT